MKALAKFSNSFIAMTISCLLAIMRKCSKFVCLPWQFLKLPWQFLNCPTSSAAAIFLYKKYWNLYISTIKRPVFRMNEPKRRAISWKPEKARCWPLSTFHHGRKCILNFSMLVNDQQSTNSLHLQRFSFTWLTLHLQLPLFFLYRPVCHLPTWRNGPKMPTGRTAAMTTNQGQD